MSIRKLESGTGLLDKLMESVRPMEVLMVMRKEGLMVQKTEWQMVERRVLE